MNRRVMARLWTVARVLRHYRVLHLIFALLPYDSWSLRVARRLMPHALSQSNQTQDAAQLRNALEQLGPIFIKFGQLLSTRPDLLPAEYIAELSQLQDSITPVPTAIIRTIIESQLNARIEDVFSRFDNEPVATASIAQVHRAIIKNGSWKGREVAVKVLRPDINDLIQTDITCMYYLAHQLKRHHRDGERLRLIEVVSQIEQHLKQELNLQCEAANTSALNHNFANSSVLFVPEVCWDYSYERMMVQEWMIGVPVSHLDTLTKLGIDCKRLARDGVEIFFTQVFSDGFFHADMHPGNVYIGTQGSSFGHYIALDCGIVGTLSETDRHYLAVNFLAFFNRDYHAIAVAHIDAGWVPPDTPVEALISAVRTTCEPYFGRPISEISLGLIITRLFDISRQFNVTVQPQLVLLQKTLLNVEGMGRLLDKDLDLWLTAKPFLERWMKNTLGPLGLFKALKREWPLIAQTLPKTPRELLAQLHKSPTTSELVAQMQHMNSVHAQTQRSLKHWKMATFLSFALTAGIIWWALKL